MNRGVRTQPKKPNEECAKRTVPTEQAIASMASITNITSIDLLIGSTSSLVGTMCSIDYYYYFSQFG